MKKQVFFTTIFLSLFHFYTTAVCTWTGAMSMLWSEPTNWSCGHVPLIMDEVIITGGMVTLDITTTVKSLSMEGGVLSGTTGLVSVTDGIVWKTGTFAANVTLLPTGTMAMLTGGTKSLSKKLTIKAACTWDAGDFLINPGGEMMIDGTGSFGVSFDGLIAFIGENTGKIVNGGTFSKVAGAGTLTVLVGFENAGGLSVGAGRLELLDDMPVSTGGITIATGAVLELADESAHGAFTSFMGTGTLELSGSGPHIFAAAYTGGLSFIFDATSVIIDAALTSTGTVTVKSGTIAGAGSLTMSGTGVWTGGRIDLPTTVGGSATLALSGAADKVLTKTLTQGGTATWSGGLLIVNAPGIFSNTGTFTATHDMNITKYIAFAAGSFVNSGTFKKDGGSGTSAFVIPYSSTGSTSILTGRLQFDKATTFTSGTLTVSAGTFFDCFGDISFAAASAIAGTGKMIWAAGTSSIATTSVGALDWEISGGTLNVNVALEPSISTLLLSSGTLGGTGSFRHTGTFTWTGGTLDLNLTAIGSSSISLSGSGTKALEATLTQSGSATWSAGDLAIQNGGVWSNGGTFTASSTGGLTFSGAAGSFSNSATFRKTTIGTLTVSISFTNSGTLTGIGTITFNGSISNTGTVAPGLSPGILTISGNYTNGAMLDLEILDGTGAGTGHDKLIVTVNAALAGILKVTEIGTVPNGTYVVLECQGGSPCITGTFTGLDLPAGYTHTITGTMVSVTKSVLPVELTFFEARLQGRDVRLRWQTASELNNDLFTVERSFDGLRFEVIGSVSGHGTTNLTHDYEHLDKGLTALPGVPQTVYYRLRQTDLDGSFDFSSVEAVRLEEMAGGIAIRHIYGSGSGGVSVVFHSELATAPVELRLFDTTGRLITQETVASFSGEMDMTLAAGLDLSGCFILTAQSGNWRESRRVFVK